MAKNLKLKKNHKLRIHEVDKGQIKRVATPIEKKNRPMYKETIYQNRKMNN